MKRIIVYFLASWTITTTQAQDDLKLWYTNPARIWTEALPIGNGNLGAMVFGGVQQDHLQLNESTFWTGRPRSYQRPDAHLYLDTIRQLLFQGKQAAAEALAQQHFMGRKDPDEDEYIRLKAAWLKKVRTDTSLATADAKNWPLMTLPTLNGWETAGLDGVDGAIWFQINFTLPADLGGKALWLDLGRIRDLDYTYINGHLIGSAEGISTKRHYLIPATALHAGENKLAVQVINFDDKGGFTGLKGDTPPFILYPEGTTADKAMHLSVNWSYHIQNQNPPPLPKYEAEYQPFGDLYLQFAKQTPENYHRELDLSTAIAKTTYTAGGIHYTREYFSSAADKTIVIHLTADKPGSIDVRALLSSPQTSGCGSSVGDNTVDISQKARDGVVLGTTYLHVNAIHGNTTADNVFHGRTPESDTIGITVTAADEVTLTITAATTFVNYHDVSANADAIAKARLQAVKNKSWATLKSAHIEEYQKLFNTFSLHLGNTPAPDVPTDQRIIQYTPEKDPDFIALYVQYARYLLIASSRPNSAMPANLQGLWNDDLTPPWGSKYTTNINLEMNYWPSETLNLGACAKPLFHLIKDLSVAGQATAKDYYNAPGWVLHHNTDLWCGTAPINASNHGIWPTGGAWLCQQIWEHYLFTLDTAFLKEYYPVLRASADFFVHFLIKDPKTGRLISTPSASPEHGGLVAGPTMDHEIIRTLFQNAYAAAAILHIDSAFQKNLREKADQLAPLYIGRYGQLQEWLEDKDDTADTHRHISHMYALYPGNSVHFYETNLADAFKKSLSYRGDDGTGWSLAWKVNCWARLEDGDHALKLLNKLLSNAVGATGEHGGVYPNMFDAHPPFQIDGNFGGAAGVGEMLVQSDTWRVLEILPALPSALPDGEVKGIKARGGYELDIKWQHGVLQSLTLRSATSAPCKLRYHDQSVILNTVAGNTYHFNGQLK